MPPPYFLTLVSYDFFIHRKYFSKIKLDTFIVIHVFFLLGMLCLSPLNSSKNISNVDSFMKHLVMFKLDEMFPFFNPK